MKRNRLAEEKLEFCKWLSANFEKIPEFEIANDSLAELVELFEEKFMFRRSEQGVYHFDACFEIDVSPDALGSFMLSQDPNLWYSRDWIEVEMEIRLWKTKRGLQMSIVRSLDYFGKKVTYYHGNPRKFLEEATSRYSIHKVATKFGI